MAFLRRFRACSDNRKWERRCTRIRRDERGWYAYATTDLDRSQSRFVIRTAFALSLLIRVNLRLNFLAAGGTRPPGRRSNAGPSKGTPPIKSIGC